MYGYRHSWCHSNLSCPSRKGAIGWTVWRASLKWQCTCTHTLIYEVQISRWDYNVALISELKWNICNLKAIALPHFMLVFRYHVFSLFLSSFAVDFCIILMLHFVENFEYCTEFIPSNSNGCCFLLFHFFLFLSHSLYSIHFLTHSIFHCKWHLWHSQTHIREIKIIFVPFSSFDSLSHSPSMFASFFTSNSAFCCKLFQKLYRKL